MYVNISPITLSRDIAPNPQPKEGFFRIKNNRDPKNYLYIDGKQNRCYVYHFNTLF